MESNSLNVVNMASAEGKMEELQPDIYQDLLVVDEGTHFRVGPIHNMVILETKDMGMEEQKNPSQPGMDPAFRVAAPAIQDSFKARRGAMLHRPFYLNYTTK